MELSELSKITGDSEEHLEQTLHDKSEHAELDEPNIQNTNDLVGVIKAPDDDLTCPECGFHAKNKIGLSGHMSKHYGRGYKQKTEVKEHTGKEVSALLLPENLAYLKMKLKAYGAKGLDNIILGMENNPLDTTELDSLLRANDNKANVPYILKLYSNFIGQPLPDNQITPHNEPSAFDDILSRKKKEADMRMYDSYIGGGHESKEVAELKKEINQLTELFTRKDTDSKFEKLEGLLKETKERNDRQVGSVSEVVEKLLHELEKRDLQHLHEREIDAKNKVIQEMTNNSNLPLAEKMMTRVADSADRFLGGVGKFNADLISRTASNDLLEKVQNLRMAGFQPPEIMQLINATKEKPRLVDAEAEYEKIERMPEPKQPDLLEQKSKEMFERNNPPLTPVKINVDG